MKPVRFDLTCEGDVEEFLVWAKERVASKKQTSVVLGVPNLHWPSMVIDMLLSSSEDEPDVDQVYMDVDFDIKHVDDSMVLNEDDIEDMLNDMDEDELRNWIDKMLDDYESDKDDEDGDNE
jgi:hypothetical protein